MINEIQQKRKQNIVQYRLHLHLFQHALAHWLCKSLAPEILSFAESLCLLIRRSIKTTVWLDKNKQTNKQSKTSEQKQKTKQNKTKI